MKAVKPHIIIIVKLHTKFHVNHTAGLLVLDISIVIIASIAKRPCMHEEQTISKLIHLLTVEMATVPLGLNIILRRTLVIALL